MDSALIQSLDAVVLARAAERILLVIVGALAVYLGYSLFRNMPTASRSEGKLELPGGVSIFLTRIGPGVFFALFGCLIIGYSATRPVEFSLPTLPGAVVQYSGLGKTIQYSGLGEADPPKAIGDLVMSGLDPATVVARLNGILARAQKDMSRVEAAEWGEAIRAAKFAVMLTRWKPEWGDRAAFERWARENGNRDPPDDLVPGATIVYKTEL